VAVVGALLAGVPAIPVNPKSGPSELAHIVADAEPQAVAVAADVAVPEALRERRRIVIDLDNGGDARGLTAPAGEEPGADEPALIVYTSGTTGPPKGSLMPRRAISSNLDFGVPTMYRRLADAAEQSPQLAATLGRARLLVSGSAALPAAEHARLRELTGRTVVERYGMTETLMNTAVPADAEPAPGTVGPPVPGVQLRLVDDDGAEIEAGDDATIGEIQVRGPNLFLGYLNRPDATAEAMRDGWFATGDMATRTATGYIRIVGRRATDLIKSGGYKIGAGEIEGCLREHPAVEDAAVTGEPDPDLGERVTAWVVLAPGAEADEAQLIDHVAGQLAPHKRPRAVRFLADLPRNELGKVQKQRLGSGAG
jgi:malonyl-CoA/methylmalonyl-CoA synthetase